MTIITNADILKVVKNRFEAVLLASHRTRQLSFGSKELVHKKGDKDTVIALREMAEKKVLVDDLYNSMNKDLTDAQDGIIEEDLSVEEIIKDLPSQKTKKVSSKAIDFSEENLNVDD